MKVVISWRHLPTALSLGALLAAGVAAVLWAGEHVQFGRWGRGERWLEGGQIFWPVPEFSLVERSSRQVTLADLRGKVWIANFIYTHCTETCPLQSAVVARLQAEFSEEPGLRFVSITVDPEQDTPAVLAEYATRFGADPERWLFLTGDKRIIRRLAVEGFRLGVEERKASGPSGEDGWPDPAREQRSQSAAHRSIRSLFGAAPALAHPGHPGAPLMHSSRLVLVDREARIRGYYHSDEETAVGQLRRDVRGLLKKGGA